MRHAFGSAADSPAGFAVFCNDLADSLAEARLLTLTRCTAKCEKCSLLQLRCAARGTLPLLKCCAVSGEEPPLKRHHAMAVCSWNAGGCSIAEASPTVTQDQGVPPAVVGWLAEMALDRLDSMMGNVTDGVYADRAGEVAVRALPQDHTKYEQSM